MSERTLITGGAGFIGTNLADRILSAGRPVIVYDNLSRAGVGKNLRWLCSRHGALVDVVQADLRDHGPLSRAVTAADHIFHLAGQVAVTTSLEEPLRDAAINLFGTLNLLEAARSRSRPPTVVFTSTNKVYGSLDDLRLRPKATRYEPDDADLRGRGINESRPLSFCTPYGCSKGAADQYVLDYGRHYRLPAVVFRMSCIYGPHQFGTEDQGWVAHFLISALDREPITVYGDGKQLRDVLFVDDLVDALLCAEANASELAGRAFNIGGGPGNSLSLVELLSLIADLTGARPLVELGPWRQGDQRYYVSDTTTFQAATGWRARVQPTTGVRLLHDWLRRERSDAPPAAAIA